MEEVKEEANIRLNLEEGILFVGGGHHLGQ